MNSVVLIGRLTRDPEVRYTTSQMAVARFSIAIDRMAKQDEEKKVDYPNIIAFGKTAELCERFLAKGRQVGIQGRIQTGSYMTKTGETRYTTDVVADRVEFLGSPSGENRSGASHGDTGRSRGRADEHDDEIPEGFEALTEDDMPF